MTKKRALNASLQAITNLFRVQIELKRVNVVSINIQRGQLPEFKRCRYLDVTSDNNINICKLAMQPFPIIGPRTIPIRDEAQQQSLHKPTKRITSLKTKFVNAILFIALFLPLVRHRHDRPNIADRLQSFPDDMRPLLASVGGLARISRTDEENFQVLLL